MLDLLAATFACHSCQTHLKGMHLREPSFLTVSPRSPCMFSTERDRLLTCYPIFWKECFLFSSLLLQRVKTVLTEEQAAVPRHDLHVLSIIHHAFHMIQTLSHNTHNSLTKTASILFSLMSTMSNQAPLMLGDIPWRVIAEGIYYGSL